MLSQFTCSYCLQGLLGQPPSCFPYTLSLLPASITLPSCHLSSFSIMIIQFISLLIKSLESFLPNVVSHVHLWTMPLEQLGSSSRCVLAPLQLLPMFLLLPWKRLAIYPTGKPLAFLQCLDYSIFPSFCEAELGKSSLRSSDIFITSFIQITLLYFIYISVFITSPATAGPCFNSLCIHSTQKEIQHIADSY